jgi:hypothetical protein
VPDSPWKALLTELSAAVRVSMPELIDLPKVSDFVTAKAEAFAREKWLAINAATPAERAEHEANLRHLVAQVRGEAIELAIQENHVLKEKIGRILETAGNVVIRFIPALLGK